jgi:hypothetical protein
LQFLKPRAVFSWLCFLVIKLEKKMSTSQGGCVY